MKRKISLFLVLVCAFWSCAGALADGFLSPGSSEVTAAFDAAGLKYSQLDISNSGDVFRISYAPATSTQLDSIVVTIHVMESSATVLGPSIGDIDGGLIALTRFSGEIGFYPEEYLEIIRLYLGK